MASFLCACDKAQIRMPFSDVKIKQENTEITFSKTDALTKGFAYDLVTFSDDYIERYSLEEGAGILVDINGQRVLYAQNAFEQRYPASITKILTALVALDNCSLDESIICTGEVESIADPTAVKLGLKLGDKLTLDQALRLCLINSYNDVAVAIACHVAGTEEEFAKLMCEKALSLGATSSHFTDASGLGSDNHYTSVYDLYLIFNEAVKNPTILEIIQSTDYSTVYLDKYDKEVTGTATSTNQFFRGMYQIPENVTVVGGKTGTTLEAGYCLMLLAKDKFSNPYIAIILGADSRDNLYSDMTDLLLQITN